jgi:RNA polymerase sigma factor (sigma-70 family)
MSAPVPDAGADTLDRLLERLNSGDPAAAEEVFRTYEPYLRMLVHRQIRPPLRAKFDSMDVVQSVWADVLEGVRDAGWHFNDRAHLQAFLARLARNRFLDRCRKHRKALAREERLTESPACEVVASAQPRPSEVAQRDELWDQMLALCPPAHHGLLRLKSQGLPLAEIAARTGLHEGSVRRILYDLAARVAFAREKSPSPVPLRLGAGLSRSGRMTEDR